MNHIADSIKPLLKEAEQLKTILEKRFVLIEKDIQNIPDENTREYLKNALSLARENKLNIADFLKTIEEKCQQKS